MAITLSERAADRIQKFLAQRGKGIGLRLGVRTSGCSGMAYTLEFVDESLPDDIAFESGGVTVLIDPMSFQYLMGAEIDYQESLEGARFVINNPNAQSTCGCGSSFSV